MNDERRASAPLVRNRVHRFGDSSGRLSRGLRFLRGRAAGFNDGGLRLRLLVRAP